MLGEIFYWIFNMSIAAAICMIPVLLIRLFKKIPRRIFIWLWLVPLIRMCVPVGISSKYGIMTLLSKFTTKTITIAPVGDHSTITMMNHVMGAESYFPITYKLNLLEELFNIASIVWLTVALAVILTLTIVYWTTLRELRDATKWEENVYISNKIRSPAVYGILKPKIILPTSYKESELNYILLHERAHIKRKDNFICLFTFIVVGVHWFNPLAWLMLKLLYSDIELACDEAVLSRCSESERKEYARALLSTAEKTNVFAASFGGSKIRIRIESILSYKRISLFSIAAFSALIAAICYVLLTNAS